MLRVLPALFLPMAVSAMAGLSQGQRKQALVQSASSIMAKCNRSHSPCRKCFPHVSAAQCRAVLQHIVGPCKKQARWLLVPRGKSSEPARTLRKAISVFMRMCSGGRYSQRPWLFVC